MGIFGGKKRDPDEGLPTLEDSPVDLSGVDLQNLLYTTGGGYLFRVHPDHIAQSRAILQKNFASHRYPDWWKGTAYLVLGNSNGFEAIWVRVQGVNVDKLTQTTLDEIRHLLVQPVPVRCELTMLGEKSNLRPSVKISAPKKKKKKEAKATTTPPPPPPPPPT
jgi:hypothetical protein